MRVYKFMSCRYGLKALAEPRLKVSEINSLNDPFELLPFDLSDPVTRKGVTDARAQIGKRQGMLCFSLHKHNPVLWSHYAESHRGLCLGFDIPEDDRQKAVEYVKDPIRMAYQPNLDTVMQMLFTKYEHWAYESEIRMWVGLDDKSRNGYYYKDFDGDLQLKEVIVGAASQISRRKTVHALGRSDGVTITKARLAYDAFKVVEDETGF